jgi:kynurenine formamidase
MLRQVNNKFSLRDVERLAEKVRNWGKWGPDDQIGTLNYVTPDKIVEAAKEIKLGEVYSLSILFGPSGPYQQIKLNRFNPIHLMIATGTDVAAGQQQIGYADDIIIMPLQCATQWDALSHIFWKGKMYNGRDMHLVTVGGAKANSIVAFKDRIVGRGVLLDAARWQNVEALPKGFAIHAEDLDKIAEFEGVKIKEGDFLLIRTGQIGEAMKSGWGDYVAGPAPGLSLDTAEWLWEKRVAAVASDTWGVEVIPNEVEELVQPWHHVVIPNMGLVVGEIFYLEELAKACAKYNRYTFFFVAPPLPIEGAVGSPVNPLAIL